MIGKAKLSLTMMLLLLLLAMANAKKRFAMNKPHMLFQVSSREPISINTGWGYWTQQQQTFSPFRLRYENTNEDLYCQMTEHNGETHFREYIKDTRYDVATEIKYQSPNNTDSWQANIDMNRSASENDINSAVFPFVYFTIENNDYNNIDKVGYHSQKKLLIERMNRYIKISVKQKDHIKEVFHVKGLQNHKLDIFGLVGNVSETWNIRSIINEFKNLKELQRFPQQDRSPNSKLRQWQDYQLQQIKLDQWEDKEYMIVFITTEFKDSFNYHIKMVQNQKPMYAPFNHEVFDKTSSELLKLYEGEPKQKLLQHVLFNLLGGIAHYYGPLYAQNSLLKQEQTTTYSTTPSRLIFPRCFLWDDGFHLTILADKHPQKSLQFLQQWINKVDLFGWIAREQIRGYEVSAMMPDSTFIYQDSLEGNPPTLMLPIRYMIEKYPDNQQLRSALKKNMWKLEKWFKYFKTTQSHFDLTDVQQIEQNIKFRWRCKDSCQNGNFMGSGLDDYPRQDSKQLSKQHVDLISWLYFFAESLEKISDFLGQQKGIKYYGQLKRFYNETLHSYYLDHTDMLFKDISVSESQNINEFVTHIGYINLFPFMMGMVADGSQQFKKIIAIMEDPNILWSDDGIRSLSISDNLYGKGDNYWRGAIWMPINYMILRACKLYYPQSSKQLHDRLRANLMKTVENNYEQTGYLYENYHKGSGNRGFPFYGWTSLINPIILDLY